MLQKKSLWWCVLLVIITETKINGLLKENPYSTAEIPESQTTTNGGAEDIFPGEFPFVVYLTARGSNNVRICAGSLISPDTIVTSAYCLFDNIAQALASPSAISVIAGSVKIDDIGSPAQMRTGRRVHVPHGFFANGSYVNHDIAVVKLDREFELSDTVQPIDLPETDLEVATVSDKGTVIGLPNLEGENIRNASTLQKVEGTPIVEKEKCSKAAFLDDGSSSEDNNTDNIFCVGYPYLFWCSYDAGGPFVVISKTSSTQKMILYGVAGVHRECTSYPVFSSIMKYRNWIEETSGASSNKPEISIPFFICVFILYASKFKL